MNLRGHGDQAGDPCHSPQLPIIIVAGPLPCVRGLLDGQGVRPEALLPEFLHARRAMRSKRAGVPQHFLGGAHRRPSEHPWMRSDPGANSRAALAAAPRVESSQAVGAIPIVSAMAAMHPFMEGLLAETPHQPLPNPSDDGDSLENGGR